MLTCLLETLCPQQSANNFLSTVKRNNHLIVVAVVQNGEKYFERQQLHSLSLAAFVQAATEIL